MSPNYLIIAINSIVAVVSDSISKPTLICPCSIQGGDLLSLAPQVRLQILLVVMKRIENQEDLNPGLRELRRKRSTGQDPSTVAVTMARLMAPCHFQDSLRV